MIRRFALILIPFAAACASDESSCERAADHLAACFPDQATIAQCDPDTADAIADMPCSELAGWGGKSDNPYCFWTPWLCTGDGDSGGSSSSSRKIEVAVDECLGLGCSGVQSAGCGLVTLHDKDDKQIAKALTSGGGRVTFSGIPKGSYTVKVHKSDGTLASMMLSDYGDQTGPAKQKVDLGSGETPWARFSLPNGTAAAVTQCAELRGNITVTDSHGTKLDRHAAEWNWFVELVVDGDSKDLSRLLFIYPDSNVVDFGGVPKGTAKIRYYRMDIPTYAQKINPDYEQLLHDYRTSDAPLEYSVTVGSSQFNKTIDVSRKIVDPQAH